MTKVPTSTTAETSTVEQSGLNTLELRTKEIELIRWAMSVTSSTLAAQEGRTIPKKESVALIAAMSELDSRIYEQTESEMPDSGYEQLTLF